MGLTQNRSHKDNVFLSLWKDGSEFALLSWTLAGFREGIVSFDGMGGVQVKILVMVDLMCLQV